MVKRVLVVLIIVFMQTGCTGNPAVQESPWVPEVEALETSTFSDAVEEKEPYQLFVYQNDYTLSLYEPPTGCYLGADITADKKIQADIHRFELLTKKKHGLYLYNMELHDSYPMTWVLDCISQMKTPEIVIRPTSGVLSGDTASLIELAQDFGEFYVPMFVQFYPVDSNYNAEKYVEIYRKAKDIFTEYASNVAFVWTVDTDFVYDSKKYYPGDDYVDWVGIRLLQSNQEEKKENQFTQLDYFYYEYQKIKPIMISGLAISHFSSIDHVYHTNQAAREITEIYQKVVNQYPRIKAINYLNYDETGMGESKIIKNNYLLTDDETIMNSYAEAIAQEKYLFVLDVASQGDTSSELNKSPFKAYKIGDRYYISENSLLYDTKLKKEWNADQKTNIDGQDYYDIQMLEKQGAGRFVIEKEKKQLLYYEKNLATNPSRY